MLNHSNSSRFIPRLAKGLLLLATLPIYAACSPSFEGEYADPAKAEIIDDKWNEADRFSAPRGAITLKR